MAANSELACVYSALILHDADISITADKITTLIHAAGVSVEPIWPTLFAKALQGKDVGALVSSLGSPGAAVASQADQGGGSGGGGAAAEQQAVEEDQKRNEDEDSGEESEDMGFGLFDD